MKWTTIQIRKWKLQKTWFWLWKTRFYKMLVICNCFRWSISIKWRDSWSFLQYWSLPVFFNAPMTQWQPNDAYQQGKLIVDIIHVANNYAEHTVTMSIFASPQHILEFFFHTMWKKYGHLLISTFFSLLNTALSSGKKTWKNDVEPCKNWPCGGVKFGPISTKLCKSYFLS